MKTTQFSIPEFPSYLTSHTQPQNLKQYIANKERLNEMKNKIDINKRRSLN